MLKKIYKCILLMTLVLLTACNEKDNEPDADGDGIADKIDIFPNDPTEFEDSDNDGVGDNKDAFPFNASENSDSDGDGLGDMADLFPYDSKERVDTDGDGFGDNSDNCFLLYNPKQNDHNNDGLGDLCSLNDTGAVYTVLSDSKLMTEECQESNDVPMNQQDCFNGRDSLRIKGGLEKYGKGIHSNDYTKLDSKGGELAFDAQEWSCVRDNVTGSIWENKTQSDQASIHHETHTYFYRENLAVADDTCPFYDVSSGTNCTIEALITRTNSEKLCGRENWVLPSVADMYTILNFHTILKTDPVVDHDFFPNRDYLVADLFQENYDRTKVNSEDLIRLRFNGNVNFDFLNELENYSVVLTSPAVE